MAARRRPDDRVPLSQRGLDPLQTQADFRQRVLRAYQADFPDFGPTLACEKLAERGLVVSRETLRRWLIQEGSWQPRQRRDPHRRRRARRACFGELVPMDTSLHDGTEGRGAALVRVNLIDDATSRIRAGFSAGETVEAHFDLLGQWLRRSGRPVALYTDRDSIFEYQSKGRGDPEGLTQLGRALQELGIELILVDTGPFYRAEKRTFLLCPDTRHVFCLTSGGADSTIDWSSLAR